MRALTGKLSCENPRTKLPSLSKHRTSIARDHDEPSRRALAWRPPEARRPPPRRHAWPQCLQLVFVALSPPRWLHRSRRHCLPPAPRPLPLTPRPSPLTWSCPCTSCWWLCPAPRLTSQTVSGDKSLGDQESCSYPDPGVKFVLKSPRVSSTYYYISHLSTV